MQPARIFTPISSRLLQPHAYILAEWLQGHCARSRSHRVWLSWHQASAKYPGSLCARAMDISRRCTGRWGRRSISALKRLLLRILRKNGSNFQLDFSSISVGQFRIAENSVLFTALGGGILKRRFSLP